MPRSLLAKRRPGPTVAQASRWPLLTSMPITLLVAALLVVSLPVVSLRMACILRALGQ